MGTGRRGKGGVPDRLGKEDSEQGARGHPSEGRPKAAGGGENGHVRPGPARRGVSSPLPLRTPQVASAHRSSWRLGRGPGAGPGSAEMAANAGEPGSRLTLPDPGRGHQQERDYAGARAGRRAPNAIGAASRLPSAGG